jgi:hypothetical protein
MTAATFPDEELPRKECPMCAGSGKVRDYQLSITPNGVPSYFTVDPETFKLEGYDFLNFCGT